MFDLIRPALTLLGAFSLLTGLLYPLAVTAASRAIFPDQAGGSWVSSGDEVVGSALIGQNFDKPGYFWGRPSATAPGPNNAAASTGSNLGPSNPALHDAVTARIAALRAASPGSTGPVPIDLVTASGSGLDPEISVAAALFQLGRVAQARRLAPEAVRQLLDAHVQKSWAGLVGEPRVNVLELNMALDGLGPNGT